MGDDAYAVMRDLKRLVDPGGVMNAGVIFNDDPGVHTRHIKASPPVGDHGLRYPRLADAATHDERLELEGRGFDGAYSFVRTCEIVLSDRMGRQYESLVYLVDEASDPGSGRRPPPP